MNCTINWDIIMSVRDQGNLDLGLSQIMRGNWEFLEEMRSWHVEIIIIDFKIFIKKCCVRNPFWFHLRVSVEREPGYLVLKSPQIPQSFSEDLMLWLMRWSLLS